MPSRVVSIVLVLLFLIGAPSMARAGEKLTIAVHEKDNLQHLVLWTAMAKATPLFEREGVDVEIVVPAKGTTPDAMVARGEADAAILAPGAYLHLVSEKAPIVIVANVFRNDGYALVVRRAVADERKVTGDGSVRERLAALKGAKIGVPPPAFGRFKALLASQGLDVDKDVKAEVLLARDQETSFRDAKVDAIFVATPALDKAVIAAGGVVVVNDARGEVPELANRQTHVMAVSQRVLAERRPVVAAAVRAIAAAEKRIHASPGDVAADLARAIPSRDAKEIEAIVRLYEPAVPESPEVRAQDLGPALALIPESIPKPNIAGIDLAPFVANDLASTTKSSSRSAVPLWIPILGAAIGLVATVLLRRRFRRRLSASRSTPSEPRKGSAGNRP